MEMILDRTWNESDGHMELVFEMVYKDQEYSSEGSGIRELSWFRLHL